MCTASDDTQRVLEILRQAVDEALEKKRRLGQYAVIWRDGKVMRLEPDGTMSPIDAGEPEK
jgi:hypothetical protein